MSNRTCAVLKALRDMGFPDDLATKIRMERAVLTIQSFYRRSLFRVNISTDYYGGRVFHFPVVEMQRPGYVHWNPRHAQHGSAVFYQAHESASWRQVKPRYKPLGIVLKAMMKEIIKCHKTFFEHKQRCSKSKKRKKLFWKVTLVRRSKFFEDLPIISVYRELA